MAWGLVYFAEHYVVDILMGWGYVAGAFWFWKWWEQRRAIPFVAEDGYPDLVRSDSREHRR